MPKQLSSDCRRALASFVRVACSSLALLILAAGCANDTDSTTQSPPTPSGSQTAPYVATSDESTPDVPSGSPHDIVVDAFPVTDPAPAFVACRPLPASCDEPSASETVWTDETLETVPQACRGEQVIFASSSRTARANLVKLREALALSSTSGAALELPLPNGQFGRFAVRKNTSTLSPELAAKYPEISNYDVVSVDDPYMRGVVDVTPLGFHAMLFTAGDTIYIDPVFRCTIAHYIVYYRGDYINHWGKTFGR